MEESRGTSPWTGEISRRTVVRGALVGGLGLASGGLLAACGDSDGGSASQTTGGAAGSPKRGGTLRVGAVGAGSAETLDPQRFVNSIDGVRDYQLYDPLVYYNLEGTGLDYLLAESIEPNATGDTWTIRLRDGVEFHNGKTLDAEDVRYSMQRMGEDTSTAGAVFKTDIVPSSYKVLDKRTLRFSLKAPNFLLADSFSDYQGRIVPVGFDVRRPVGTGPFKFVSFDRGRESTFVRFENHWREGKPYLDEVRIISFEDSVAMVNALLSDQVDVIVGMPLSQVEQVQSHARLKTIQSLAPQQWIPIAMRMDVAPWNDVRVRQAMKLLVDRPAMVQNVFGGKGVVANDYQFVLPTFGDPGIPQRERDIEQAKSLLKAAGQADLRVEMATAEFVPEAVPSAQVFAQQAKDAGVTIDVRKLDTGVFYGDEFLKRPLSNDYWPSGTYQVSAASSLLPKPGTPFNETHFADPEWRRHFLAAQATRDREGQVEHIHECMRIENERGGYVIWGAQHNLDGASKRVEGISGDRVDALGSYKLYDAYLTS